jgi:hypothetical protein
VTLSRRTFLRRLAAAAAGISAASCGARSWEIWRRPGVSGAPPPEGVHLQFGSDAGSEVVASWSTATTVTGAHVRFGTPAGGLGRTIPAATRTYVDGISGIEVYTHHVVMDGLAPSTNYIYEVMHEGASPVAGTFRTAPCGRAPLRFTSFGDQSTPVIGDGLASPWAGHVVGQVESLDPLFHLLNGDLCYANVSPDRVATWSHFFANNARSARYRPWMPAPGNHENERGNGPYGFAAFQTRFAVPDNGSPAEHRGLWYAFTAGSVRIIALSADDVCFQDGGDTYVHGYSDGAQCRWLEATLRNARADPVIDWIVVCMHQTAISSADNSNGCDRGIRESFVPLFDRYGVDLVVCGHEHHYERSHPLRGAHPTGETLRPRVVGHDLRVVDTRRGTVHMVLGGGGTSRPSNALLTDPPTARVVVGVRSPEASGKRAAIYVREDAREWSAMRDAQNGHGFAAFDVEPGSVPGGPTRMLVTYYRTADGDAALPEPFERFVLERTRSDGPPSG